VLQGVAGCCRVLQGVAVSKIHEWRLCSDQKGSVLPCVALHCIVFPHGEESNNHEWRLRSDAKG